MSDGIATTTAPGADRRESEDWWRTSIIEMSPGVIRYRGYPIEELIAQRVSLAQMIWLMTRGELPSKAQGALLEAALMSAVDHGPQAPSIAIARMAATCGVGLNSAMASAVNVLGDVHGGAGEQCVALLLQWLQLFIDSFVVRANGILFRANVQWQIIRKLHRLEERAHPVMVRLRQWIVLMIVATIARHREPQKRARGGLGEVCHQFRAAAVLFVECAG